MENKRKELAEGTIYLSVSLKAIPLNIKDGKLNLAFFPNTSKTKETQPDFISEYGGVWKRKKKAKTMNKQEDF